MSSAVSDWGDQSAAANDFTQAVSGARPSAGASMNQQSAPSFDGVDDSLGSAALSSFVSASAHHAFVAMRADTVTADNVTSYLNNPILADGGAGWWGIFLRNAAGTIETLGFHWDSTAGQRVAVASGFVRFIRGG